MLVRDCGEMDTRGGSLVRVRREAYRNVKERDRLLKTGARSLAVVEFVLEIGAMCVIVIADAPEERRREH